MPSTCIKGKYVLCKVNDQDVIELISEGAVFQKDGEIIDVGKYDDIKARYTADEEIGSDHHMVLPGLVNAHQHGGGVPHPLMGAPDDNLELWFNTRMQCKPADSYLDNMFCIARLIESGITTVMHSHPVTPNYEETLMSTLKAYQDGGIRVAFALGMRDQNNLVYQDDDQFLALLPPSLATRVRQYLANFALSENEYFTLFAKLYERLGSGASPKMRILHGPTMALRCSDELLVRIKESADQYCTGIHTHVLETMYQKLYALKHFGKTFVEHLNDIGFLGPRISFAHGVWVTAKEIELLAESGASICHNPSSNLRLRSGIAPVNRMVDKGVNVALGTDGLSLNDDEDILQDLRLCANLHHIPGLGKPRLTPGQLFKMITINGARATLFSDQIGTLEKGKRADVILVNLERLTEPYRDPEVKIIDVLLGRGKTSDIDTVMVDGEILLRNRRHTKIDRAGIVASLRESLSRDAKPGDIARARLAQELRPYVYDFYNKRDQPAVKPFYYYNNEI